MNIFLINFHRYWYLILCCNIIICLRNLTFDHLYTGHGRWPHNIPPAERRLPQSYSFYRWFHFVFENIHSYLGSHHILTFGISFEFILSSNIFHQTVYAFVLSSFISFLYVFRLWYKSLFVIRINLSFILICLYFCTIYYCILILPSLFWPNCFGLISSLFLPISFFFVHVNTLRFKYSDHLIFTNHCFPCFRCDFLWLCSLEDNLAVYWYFSHSWTFKMTLTLTNNVPLSVQVIAHPGLQICRTFRYTLNSAFIVQIRLKSYFCFLFISSWYQ